MASFVQGCCIRIVLRSRPVIGIASTGVKCDRGRDINLRGIKCILVKSHIDTAQFLSLCRLRLVGGLFVIPYVNVARRPGSHPADQETPTSHRAVGLQPTGVVAPSIH